MSIRSPSNYGRPDWAMPISPYAPSQQPMMPQVSDVAPQAASLPPQAQTNMPQMSLPPQAQTAMPSQFGGQPNAQAFANANQNASFMPQPMNSVLAASQPMNTPMQQMPMQQQQPTEQLGAPMGQMGLPQMPPQQAPQMPQFGGVPQYGGGQFRPQGGKGGMGQGSQPQGGDWQSRFQDIMGQNWPDNQQATQQGKGGGTKSTFGSSNSWS